MSDYDQMMAEMARIAEQMRSVMLPLHAEITPDSWAMMKRAFPPPDAVVDLGPGLGSIPIRLSDDIPVGEIRITYRLPG